MTDYMIRGTAAEGQVRFFAAYTRDTAEFARAAHNLSPVCTAALGRLLTAGAMMGAMMKSEEDLLTLKIDCDGPIKGLTVTADCAGHVKGYVKVPDVDLPLNDKGKLDVAGALDLGVLSVIRDVGLKEPYVGQTILVTSEIAEDLTYYFATSEQTPSSVGLGVLLNPGNTVATAGGFIVQMMPGASEEAISAVEAGIAKVSSVTSLLSEGYTPETLIGLILGELSPELLDTIPVSFTCNCSREKTQGMIESLPSEELQEMIDEGKEIEVVCHFCSSRYIFSVEELEEMLRKKQL
ncbi:MAG: Hsp33 family molecular chaperone HslO [Lachnospiraceae bacterium]|nr:Hsp33 family molecular chaperone HslO [Lachnospiraceae bacterium]